MTLLTRFRAPRISPPAVFGKLPCHGDYLRWHVSVAEEKEWLEWLNKQAWLNDSISQPTERTVQQNAPGWLTLTPEFIAEPKNHALPWCFVLQPGVLPFSGTQWIVGVIAASRDSVGRAWPIVSYQTVHQQWLAQGLKEKQGWLFWLSRLVHHYVDMPEPMRAGERQLTEQLMLLWNIHRPHWWSRVSQQETPRHIRSQELLKKQMKDVALSGVTWMPWGEWPQQVWQAEQTGLCWFWQQDNCGGYLDARCFAGDMPVA